MMTYGPPLFELFTRLRQAGLPLGIDEYQLLVQALQAGFGLPDRVALVRLCKTLWIKSIDEERIFDYHFEQVMAKMDIDETFSSSSQLLSDQPESTSKEPFYKGLWNGIRRIFQAHSPGIPPATTPSESTSKSSAITPTSTTSVSTSLATRTSNLTTTPDLILKIEDEVQVAKAVSLATARNGDSTYDYFVQTDEYFPITRRQMKQSWRYLRRPVREGPPVELDIETTVNEIGRLGMLLEPAFVPRRINQAELLLLIDQGGSMVPFHSLSRRLAETALRGGRLGKTNIYYFHNCPVEYLYHDPAHQEAKLIEDILDGLHYSRGGVLIFSDAGAARGSFSLERVEMTKAFLDRLKQKNRYLVWLNPMPRSRWPGTTAGELMYLIPMFDVSRQGLDNAISVLRGRPIHIEASL
jgi:uncharacterized protein